ncbi:cell surface glycoprotein 1-like, partial [Hetaerina americana]|uniref:cell surface glycoprotein 1-like n=1 Tax=Hetaerina americana TaxID=62018 RepID=UPI003A7F4309
MQEDSRSSPFAAVVAEAAAVGPPPDTTIESVHVPQPTPPAVEGSPNGHKPTLQQLGEFLLFRDIAEQDNPDEWQTDSESVSDATDSPSEPGSEQENPQCSDSDSDNKDDIEPSAWRIPGPLGTADAPKPVDPITYDPEEEVQPGDDPDSPEDAQEPEDVAEEDDYFPTAGNFTTNANPSGTPFGMAPIWPCRSRHHMYSSQHVQRSNKPLQQATQEWRLPQSQCQARPGTPAPDELTFAALRQPGPPTWIAPPADDQGVMQLCHQPTLSHRRLPPSSSKHPSSGTPENQPNNRHAREMQEDSRSSPFAAVFAEAAAVGPPTDTTIESMQVSQPTPPAVEGSPNGHKPTLQQLGEFLLFRDSAEPDNPDEWQTDSESVSDATDSPSEPGSEQENPQCSDSDSDNNDDIEPSAWRIPGPLGTADGPEHVDPITYDPEEEVQPGDDPDAPEDAQEPEDVAEEDDYFPTARKFYYQCQSTRDTIWSNKPLQQATQEWRLPQGQSQARPGTPAPDELTFAALRQPGPPTWIAPPADDQGVMQLCHQPTLSHRRLPPSSSKHPSSRTPENQPNNRHAREMQEDSRSSPFAAVVAEAAAVGPPTDTTIESMQVSQPTPPAVEGSPNGHKPTLQQLGEFLLFRDSAEPDNPDEWQTDSESVSDATDSPSEPGSEQENPQCSDSDSDNNDDIEPSAWRIPGPLGTADGPEPVDPITYDPEEEVQPGDGPDAPEDAQEPEDVAEEDDYFPTAGKFYYQCQSTRDTIWYGANLPMLEQAPHVFIPTRPT